MTRFFSAFLLLVSVTGFSQSSTSNAHSHNDYEQRAPFWAAWNNGFGSIEADVFLDKGEFIVAHDKKQLPRRWTLDSLYLQPLQQCIDANGGNVYRDTAKCLQLMIDIKSDAVPALTALVEKLRTYPSLIHCRSLRIVISGNRPEPSSFHAWPAWIWFDGVLQQTYSRKELERIVMLNDNFQQYSSWKGEGDIPGTEKKLLQDLITKAHQLNKKVRFWNAPDNRESWKMLMQLGVDYINTDQIEGLSVFLPARQ